MGPRTQIGAECRRGTEEEEEEGQNDKVIVKLKFVAGVEHYNMCWSICEISQKVTYYCRSKSGGGIS